MMTIRQRNRMVAVALLLPLFMVVGCPGVGLCTDLGDLIQGVRDRAVFIDSVRFTDSLLKRTLNDIQEDVAVASMSIEKETTYVLSITDLAYALPADFYSAKAVIINATPDAQGTQTPKALNYIPIEEYGKNPGIPTGRPSQWSIKTDSIKFDRYSTTETDTVFLIYAAHASDMATDTCSMQLDQQFKTLLIDKTVIYCYGRIAMFTPLEQVPLMQKIMENVAILENQLYGRPPDE